MKRNADALNVRVGTKFADGSSIETKITTGFLEKDEPHLQPDRKKFKKDDANERNDITKINSDGGSVSSPPPPLSEDVVIGVLTSEFFEGWCLHNDLYCLHVLLLTCKNLRNIVSRPGREFSVVKFTSGYATVKHLLEMVKNACNSGDEYVSNRSLTSHLLEASGFKSNVTLYTCFIDGEDLSLSAMRKVGMTPNGGDRVDDDDNGDDTKKAAAAAATRSDDSDAISPLFKSAFRWLLEYNTAIKMAAILKQQKYSSFCQTGSFEEMQSYDLFWQRTISKLNLYVRYVTRALDGSFESCYDVECSSIGFGYGDPPDSEYRFRTKSIQLKKKARSKNAIITLLRAGEIEFDALLRASGGFSSDRVRQIKLISAGIMICFTEVKGLSWLLDYLGMLEDRGYTNEESKYDIYERYEVYAKFVNAFNPHYYYHDKDAIRTKYHAAITEWMEKNGYRKYYHDDGDDVEKSKEETQTVISADHGKTIRSRITLTSDVDDRDACKRVLFER